MICGNKIGYHLSTERQCHGIVSVKSYGISDLMCEAAEWSTWSRTGLFFASETWYKMVENCYLCNNPGEEITVDEQRAYYCIFFNV